MCAQRWPVCVCAGHCSVIGQNHLAAYMLWVCTGWCRLVTSLNLILLTRLGWADPLCCRLLFLNVCVLFVLFMLLHAWASQVYLGDTLILCPSHTTACDHFATAKANKNSLSQNRLQVVKTGPSLVSKMVAKRLEVL